MSVGSNLHKFYSMIIYTALVEIFFQ